MHLLRAVLIAAVVAIACGHQTEHSTFPQQDGVLVLNESTFAVAVRTFDPLFVLFDSSSRYGRLTLQRRFADAAQTVRMYDWNATTTTRFASLDVSQLTHTLPNELKVLGLPALLLFHCRPGWPSTNDVENSLNVTLSNCVGVEGGVEVYTGGRTSMELQRFALGQPLRDVFRIDARAQLEPIVKSYLFAALFVVDGEDSQPFFDCRVLAQIDSDTSAYIVTTNQLIMTESGGDDQGDASAQVSQIPSLVLYREFGKEEIVFNGTWNKPELLQFIQKNRYNVISSYVASDAGYFYDGAADGHVLLFSDPHDPYHAILLNAIQDVADSYYVPIRNTGGHVLRFLVVSRDQETLKNALFVLDDQFPTAVVVRKISEAPSRMPFVGAATRELIANGSFGSAIRNELEKIFSPFGTSDLPDDGDDPEAAIDWRDYSDVFENKHAPFIMRANAKPYSSLANDAPRLNSQRRLIEVDLAHPSTTSADQFLSLFTNQPTDEGVRILAIASYTQLQTILLQDQHNGQRYVLVVLHSKKCYSCRQALDAVQDLPATAGVHTIALVDVDHVAMEEWPFTLQWLPGIILFEGTTQLATFPGPAAITVDALIEFVSRSIRDAATSQTV